MVKFKIDFPLSMLNKNELILNNSVTPEFTQKKRMLCSWIDSKGIKLSFPSPFL